MTPAENPVGETALWTLYHRALAARRGILDDPKAIALVEAIDYPFEQRFGRRRFATWQGLRVRAFDTQIKRFLQAKPDATVVALGEGLETQFWRVGNGRVTWVTVDLPEMIAFRERHLPPTTRTIAASALDVNAWRDARPDLITAQGLLMYLDRDAVHTLFAIAPPAAVLFDVVAPWLAGASAKARSETDDFQPPPWTYTADPRELASLPLDDLRRVPLPHAGHVLVPLVTRLVRAIDVYSARTSTTNASTTSTASTTNVATAARAATRATRRDA
ncbi:MAG TPA: class I SAM-dependent methyltransferase [Solirubrobacter sp.]|nr:class I SAM-dependent methyltransferase [Solirubrobacter sp.]